MKLLAAPFAHEMDAEKEGQGQGGGDREGERRSC